MDGGSGQVSCPQWLRLLGSKNRTTILTNTARLRLYLVNFHLTESLGARPTLSNLNLEFFPHRWFRLQLTVLEFWQAWKPDQTEEKGWGSNYFQMKTKSPSSFFFICRPDLEITSGETGWGCKCWRWKMGREENCPEMEMSGNASYCITPLEQKHFCFSLTEHCAIANGLYLKTEKFISNYLELQSQSNFPKWSAKAEVHLYSLNKQKFLVKQKL